ncbi:hypothetical protein BT67DRAFT_150669 [Trichocladium antarcticum]|uniref:Uncharacterized protein n=1 Tax=Trichocladium antarcticum TaxID=1450529 RepID=A0AAN6ZB47_9PEZI|nr:hypothetical protein BT67DRAFT_150669 [Trichocladium antarcticum]
MDGWSAQAALLAGLDARRVPLPGKSPEGACGLCFQTGHDCPGRPLLSGSMPATPGMETRRGIEPRNEVARNRRFRGPWPLGSVRQESHSSAAGFLCLANPRRKVVRWHTRQTGHYCPV